MASCLTVARHGLFFFFFFFFFCFLVQALIEHAGLEQAARQFAGQLGAKEDLRHGWGFLLGAHSYGPCVRVATVSASEANRSFAGASCGCHQPPASPRRRTAQLSAMQPCTASSDVWRRDDLYSLPVRGFSAALGFSRWLR